MERTKKGNWNGWKNNYNKTRRINWVYTKDYKNAKKMEVKTIKKK